MEHANAIRTLTGNQLQIQIKSKKIKNFHFFFSSFNEKEVDVVIDYIKKLLTPNRFRKQINESDIGVISPYKSQCQHIARRCSDWNFSDVTVGTAEIFQGQEKPIIIVSCVRNDSPGFKSDFLNDPQVGFTVDSTM